MMKMRRMMVLLSVMMAGTISYGQNKDLQKQKSSEVKAPHKSRSFQMGQWVQINNAILKELNASYVDSLPLSRMQMVGINAMLENLDPYTMYIPEEDRDDLQMMLNKSYGGIGALVYKPKKEGNLLINEPYVGTPAARAGLVCGDEVLEIEGTVTNGLTAQQCTDKMKGNPGTGLKMKVRKVRTGEIKDVVLTREYIHLSDVSYYGMLNDTTGYISQTGFTTNVSQAVKDAFLDLKKQGMTKLVLDLRGNGGGLINEAVSIVSLFVPKGSLVVSQKGKSIKEEVKLYTTQEPVDTEIPILVMVDGGSASSSEIVSGALQDMDRATIMGTRSYGKGLVQGIRPLPYGGQLKVTVAKYYTPSGRCVQALDYAKRGEDGSVKAIPDSLTHEFRTVGGRAVRDGGGITPDVEIKAEPASRMLLVLFYNGIMEDFIMEYVKLHDQIGDPDKFHLDDEDFDLFVKVAMGKKFDYRSESKALYDKLVESLKQDKIQDKVAEQLDALDKVLNMDKEESIRIHKTEILPLLEREVVARYYFRPQAEKHALQYDIQLKKALETPLADFSKLPEKK